MINLIFDKLEKETKHAMSLKMDEKFQFILNKKQINNFIFVF
jgi:hypothetical protein